MIYKESTILEITFTRTNFHKLLKLKILRFSFYFYYKQKLKKVQKTLFYPLFLFMFPGEQDCANQNKSSLFI